MTKREAEEYLVALRPKPVFAPSIRKTPSRPQEQAASPRPAQPQTTTSRPAPRVSPSILEPARPELFNFRFAADRNFKGEVRASKGAATLAGKNLVRTRFLREKGSEMRTSGSLPIRPLRSTRSLAF